MTVKIHCFEYGVDNAAGFEKAAFENKVVDISFSETDSGNDFAELTFEITLRDQEESRFYFSILGKKEAIAFGKAIIAIAETATGD